MDLSQDDIAQIQRLLAASPYSELTIETERFRISVRRSADGTWVQETETRIQPVLISGGASETAATAASPTKAVPDPSEDGLVNVFPPLPGTFYRAPKPGAAPFVEIGADVTEDMIIGIIETMKLMNPARARAAGTIVEICTSNGALVDATDVLMRVRPRKGGQ
jgi:acetyl-CoA carboxylase biotin carboxyl carrier protein